MLKTGSEQSNGQSFHRRLLSEYNTEITLDNYVAYFELKPIAKEVEHLRTMMEKRRREICDALPDWERPKGRSFTVNHLEQTLPPSVSQALSADDKLTSMATRRQQLQHTFFEQLHASYTKVKGYLLQLEKEMVVNMQRLYTQTDTDIRNMDESYLPQLYSKLAAVRNYRALNLLAFHKILKKFFERCACDNLELQRRVLEVDAVIHKSNITHPSVNLRDIALELIAVYGTVFRYTYEEATARLQQYDVLCGINAKRIVSNRDSFYFTCNFPHPEMSGHFSIRLLAGSCSIFCKKMIAEVLQCGRYPGTCCGQYANGEVNITLHSAVRGDDVFVVQSMVASEEHNLSNSGAVMELALMIHAAHLAAARRITAVVPYLAYTRNVASMSALAQLIESMGCHHIITVDMCSDQVEGMFSIPMECISAKYEFVCYLSNLLKSEGNDFTKVTVVAPSGEFLGRAKDFADALMRFNQLDGETQFVSVCTAVKRVMPSGTAASECNTESKRDRLYAAQHAAQALPLDTAQSDNVAAREQGCPPVSPVLSIASRNTPVIDGSAADYPRTQPKDSGALPPSSTCLPPQAPTMCVTDGLCAGGRNSGRSVTPSKLSNSPTTDMDARGNSTFGIEQALRRQQEGRRALVFYPHEGTLDEYENLALVGDVENRLCIITDFMIDRALNICHVAMQLKKQGAARVILVATHAVFSHRSTERLVQAPIDLIIITDTVMQDDAMRDPKLARKLRVIPIAPLLARAVEKIHTESTLPTTFEK